MNFYSRLFIFSIFTQILSFVASQASLGRTVTIQHCFEDDSQLRCRKLTEVATNTLRVNHTQTFTYQMSANELDLLKEAAKKRDFYFLRARLDSDSSDQYLQCFCKADDLANSASALVIAVTVNVDSFGKIFGIEVAPVESSDPRLLTLSDGVEGQDTLVGFLTVYGSQQGPSPDLEGYKRKVAKERAEKVAAETGDNRSFLSKYWMYIVPVVLFMLFSGQFGGQGGAGGAAA